jgi:hypothetical protein
MKGFMGTFLTCRAAEPLVTVTPPVGPPPVTQQAGPAPEPRPPEQSPGPSQQTDEWDAALAEALAHIERARKRAAAWPATLGVLSVQEALAGRYHRERDRLLFEVPAAVTGLLATGAEVARARGAPAARRK